MTKIVFTETAAETLQRMKLQAQAVTEAWRYLKPEYGQEITESLARQVVDLTASSGFGADEITVSRDGELSLYVAAGIHFGVIFHPHGYLTKPREGDNEWRTMQGGVMTRCCPHKESDRDPACLTTLDWEGACATHGTQETAHAMPAPGKWSFHS
jgi:hypothetical protein